MSKPPSTLSLPSATADAPPEGKPKHKHKSQNRPKPIVIRKPRAEQDDRGSVTADNERLDNDRPPREDSGFGRKHRGSKPGGWPSRTPRDDGGGSGYRARAEGPRGDRPPREDRSFDKPRGPKPDWKPRGDRDSGGGGGGFRGRPDGPRGDRPPREGRSFDKPRGPKPDWKPRGDRDSGGGGGGFRGRPDGPRGDRPPREGRSFDKPHGPKPDWKPRGDRDGGGGGFRGRPDGPRGDRPPREERSFDKPRGPKPDWKPRGDRDGGGGFRGRPDGPRGDRPPRGPKPDWKQRTDRDGDGGTRDRPDRDRRQHVETPRPDITHPQSADKKSDKSADKFLRVAGLNAVLSLFAAAPERIQRLFYNDEQRHHIGAVAQALAEARKPYRQVEDEELAKIAGTVLHGGVVVLADHKPVAAFEVEAALGWAARGEPLIVLDGIGNPHNLGAIARTVAFFGVKRIVLSADPRQAAPSDAAYRVAQGGLDHLDVYRSDDIAAALGQLKTAYHIVGTGLTNAMPLAALARDARPMILVLGNEEEGVPAVTLAACETTIKVPGRGAVQSLNVAASAAILVHALIG